MNTWQDRVKMLMSQQNPRMTQADLAHKVNITQGNIGHYLHNRREAPLSKIAKIAKVFNVPLKWLLFGDDPTINFKEIPSLQKQIPILKWDDFQKGILSTAQVRDILTHRVQNGETLKMTYIKDVVGELLGTLQANKAEKIDAMRAPLGDPKGVFLKEWLILDFEKKPSPGDVVLAYYEKDVIIRIYMEEGGTSFLKASDHNYPHIYKFQILATVIGRWREG